MSKYFVTYITNPESRDEIYITKKPVKLTVSRHHEGNLVFPLKHIINYGIIALFNGFADFVKIMGFEPERNKCIPFLTRESET